MRLKGDTMNTPRLVLGSKMRVIKTEPRAYVVTELVEEYYTSSYDIISLSTDGNVWEVDCWKPDQTNHWNKTYHVESAARDEYNRWRTL